MHTRRTHRRTRTGTGVALLAAAALLISGCSSGSSPSMASAAAGEAAAALAPLPRSTPTALTPYYEQKPAWRDCGVPGFQCATLKVPLDYAEPTAGDVRLALTRKKAT